MTSTNDVLAEIEARVAARRQEGKYPIGLEEQLEAEFRNILEVVHRGENVLGDIQKLLDECRQDIEKLNGRVSSKSRIPGFGIVHFVIGKLVGRQTTSLAIQVKQTLEKQEQILELMFRQFEIQQGTDVRVLNQLSRAIQDRIMMIDVLAESVLELEKKVSTDF